MPDDKLIRRIKARPAEADFDDVRRLLEQFGWSLRRRSGSHVSFKKGKGHGTIIVPLVRGKVKRAYIDQIIERLGL